MFDVIIIGGGIMGLSTAHQLKLQRPDWKMGILEKESDIGMHQTSHNSGVIHSGIYYKPGSLRARNCRKGYQQLLQFCDQHTIPYDICGKLIVATEEREVPILQQILSRGRENGLKGLKLLSSDEAQEVEPHVNCLAAIHVPQSGIVDFHQVAQTLGKLFIDGGGIVQLNTKVDAIESRHDKVIIHTHTEQLESRNFIACAGLYADRLSSSLDGQYKVLPFRGEFYRLRKECEHMVNHLIYPVPNPNFPFLGVHFTRKITGGIEAGPNAVLAFRREGYHYRDLHWSELAEILSYPGFHRLARKYWRTGLQEMYRSLSKSYFVKSLQKIVPSITPDDVVRSRSGVRAMACGRQGNLLDDFLIHPVERGIHVINAPSPAATASLAIGKEIVNRFVEIIT